MVSRLATDPCGKQDCPAFAAWRLQRVGSTVPFLVCGRHVTWALSFIVTRRGRDVSVAITELE